MNFSDPIVITFTIYIVVMLSIGLIAYRSTNNFSDYILGGRNIGSFVTALSAGASDMSGWLLMGLPGTVYVSGLSEAWIAIGLVSGAFLNWTFIAGRLRVQTEYSDNSLTLPDYFTSRFEDNTGSLRIISSIVILIFFSIYCASGIIASGRLFESTFGIPYQEALWIGAFATISYTFIGGFLAVAWTDTVQATIMVFALILTPTMILIANGGAENTFSSIQSLNPGNLDIFEESSFIGVVSLMGWGLGYFGQPHVLARFMAADSVHSIKKARVISMIWMIVCQIGAISIGVFGLAYFSLNPNLATKVSENPERVFIELTRLLFNPWISGVLLSAILAAVMSTLSCQLLVCSSTLTEDLYKNFLRKKASQAELIWVSRIMVLVIAFLAIVLAYNPNSHVLGLVSYAWAGFGCAFGPVVLISVVWKKMTKSGALAGMIVGSITVIIWEHFSFFNLYEIIPGFIFSSCAIFIFSFLGKSPSSNMLTRFQNAEQNYNSGT